MLLLVFQLLVFLDVLLRLQRHKKLEKIVKEKISISIKEEKNGEREISNSSLQLYNTLQKFRKKTILVQRETKRIQVR
tara:strand:- start:378 stop:611 length:234 start_codon:yes stop_codon:yes gene_type:complete